MSKERRHESLAEEREREREIDRKSELTRQGSARLKVCGVEQKCC